jgi:hypothetical protein
MEAIATERAVAASEAAANRALALFNHTSNPDKDAA